MIVSWLLLCTLIGSVTSMDVRYACHYPGCKCEELSAEPQSFSLTCDVISGVDVHLIPSNNSINVTQVVLRCSDSTDPVSLLDNIKQDIDQVLSLELRHCVTTLVSIFKDRFSHLQKLTLYHVRVTDDAFREVMSQTPDLEVLEITGSDVIFGSVCPFANLSRLTLNKCHIKSFNSTECPNNGTLKLSHVDLSDNELQNIPNWIPWAKYISELHFKHNNLSSVSDTILLEAVKLKVLDLSHNSLTSLPGNLLSNAHALEYLNLSVNQLTSLPENIFANTVNLTRLDLSMNRFRYLGGGLFTSLHALNILNLSSNYLSYLLNSHLSKLENLLYLELINNNLRNVPMLSAQKNLKVINLRNNRIKNVLSSSFRGCTSLEGIGLRYNLLQTLPLKNIAVSKNLVIIDVSHNDISYIDYRSEVDVSVDLTVNDSLSALRSVKILFLNNNKLTDVYRLARVFTGLQTLLLDSNKISAISSADFPPTVTSLGLSSNQITSIEFGMFTKYPLLKAVSLQFNSPFVTDLHSGFIQVDSDIIPKPEIFIAGNLYMCNCNTVYLKTYYEINNGIESKENAVSFSYFSSTLPKIPDLEHLVCITERNSTVRRLVDVPIDEFMCVQVDIVCEFPCTCCTRRLSRSCSCQHVCPSLCRCSQGGSPFGEYNYKVHCTNTSVSTVPEDVPGSTTYLHLENTNLTKLQPNQFLSLKNLKYLYLQNSQLFYLSPGSFNGLNQLTHLYLQDNHITHLSPEMLSGLWNVTHLYLQDNLLEVLQDGTFAKLSHLQYLDLSHNQLVLFSVSDFPDMPPTSVMRISENPISCSCENMFQTVPFLTIYGPNIVLKENLKCTVNESTGAKMKLDGREGCNITFMETVFLKDFDMDDCNRRRTFINETQFDTLTFKSDNRYAVTLSTLCILFAVILVAAIIAYRKRSELQAWMFVKFGVRVKSKNVGLDETGRQYDAFVSYSSHDERLVVRELAPRLEEAQGEKGAVRRYRLCLHYRDFPVGDSIADTIIESIEASKRTIMLLSDNFLASEWCRYEFQTAHHHVLKEKSHRLILVLLHDIDDRKLDPDLRVHLKEGNFLRYDDPWFWEKLYFALPDVTVDRKGKLSPKNKKELDNNWNLAFDEEQEQVKLQNTLNIE